MLYIPFLGRLSVREYAAVVFGFLLYSFETLLRSIIFFLPGSLIRYCHDLSRLAFYRYVLGTSPDKPKSQERILCDRIRDARDFAELAAIWGYVHEEHVVLTKDGYLLGLHRIPAKKSETSQRPGTSTGKPVVYLHHGLLMNRCVNPSRVSSSS
jgi:lysosomal acid lipase/cholesteryl ester hydrolase